MELYQVIIAYDGTHFKGFQRQGRTRTVQLEIEAALKKIGWQGETILAAGRTDSGVHALGQVVTFEMDWKHSSEALTRALNANLPSDVAAKQTFLAPDGFHPRYSAQARSYRYHIYFQPVRDPLRERHSWRIWPKVDLERLQSAALLIPGRRDFSPFGMAMYAQGSTIRTIFRAEWQPEAEGLRFGITGDAFLYHMVRRLVFLQIMIAQERYSLEEFYAGLKDGKIQHPGLASAAGLVLEKVHYGLSGREN
jgi:tRNA pseudouridine38-40 synthase